MLHPAFDIHLICMVKNLKNQFNSNNTISVTNSYFISILHILLVSTVKINLLLNVNIRRLYLLPL